MFKLTGYKLFNMLPYIISTQEETFKSYSDYYIWKNGRKKYEKVKEKVLFSSSIAQLNGISLQMNGMPTARDFLSAVKSTTYFMFAGQDTTILACLMTINLWEEKVNKVYRIAQQNSIDNNVKGLFRMFGLI